MTPPELDRRVLEALLQVELPPAGNRRLLLVHGRYATGASPEFSLTIRESKRRIRVVDQQSVLGILDAWQSHQERNPEGDDVLVVTTAVEDAQLGWDVRGHAIGRATRTVDRAEIVKQRFGATDLDPRIRRERWLVDALLDAEPTGGWRRAGPVLTRDAAVRALIEARLGLGDDALDAGTLLEWSQSSAGPTRFVGLPEAERTGLSTWLAESVGDVAVVLMGLVARGDSADAMALGVIASVLDEPGASPEAVLAVGGLLGAARARQPERWAFVEAVEGTLQRWVVRAEAGGAVGEDARRRVLDVVERADVIAAEAGLTGELNANAFLPSAFRARLRALAAALTAVTLTAVTLTAVTLTDSPDAAAVAAAGGALGALRRHHLARLHPERCVAAEMAVRLVRRLAGPTIRVESVAAGVAEHIRDGGWVDRALTAVWAGEAADDRVVGQAYRTVFEEVRSRRDDVDESFAARLVPWATHASTRAPEGALLIEEVLDVVVAPLATADSAPLVLVLDGMSAAVAAELGEQLAARAWVEVSPELDRRAAAVATIPSVTRASRTSLLTGRPAVGDQSTETDGFATFWRRHRRTATLVHKAGIGGPAGHRLAEPLVAALAGDDVVGVVLNTIDDALDHGREGDRTSWRLTDITYLPDLLDAARSYRRPVVLVGDHGHVLERSTTVDGLTAAEGVESARWRTGEPAAGEVALAGPRVLLGDGHVVVPWREDIRYTRRRSGYHGGASLAEMAVPILVLLPSVDLLPAGWSVIAPESTVPDWWTGRPVAERPAPITKVTPRRRNPVADTDGLFEVPEPAPAPPASLGSRVVASPVYDVQRKFVPRAPDRPAVAALVDTLVSADGRMSPVAVAAAVGRAGRDPDFVVATVQRLLNVEGYPVLSVEGGRTVRLNVDLLCQQFGVTT